MGMLRWSLAGGLQEQFGNGQEGMKKGVVWLGGDEFVGCMEEG